MSEEVIQLLRTINNNLEAIKKEDNLPRLIYAIEIAKNYQVNLNKATDFCKRYGTNFGGYCIEIEKFKEILQTKGMDIFS